MPNVSVREEALKLLANEEKLGAFIAESAVEAMILARKVMNGHIKAPVNTRLTAAQKVMDNAKMIIEELRGHEKSREGKRGTAPTTSRSAAGSRQAWIRGNPEHNPDGTPVALGKSSVELSNRKRPT